MSVKGGGTIGFRYIMSLHMGLGIGPNDELKEIRVGDLTAWKGQACLTCDGFKISIDAPNLFGGDEKEGGILGTAYIYPGCFTQELQGPLTSPTGDLPGIAASLGGDVPNFRGVTTVWYHGMVCAMNPYPKEWAFRVRRAHSGWDGGFNDGWYLAKAAIHLGVDIQAMNGAHILVQTATDKDWGRGLDMDMLDENSYIYAANQLCNEGFGLCMPWFRQETVGEFTQMVIDHIGGAQYVDRETGKLTLRLIRDDYDADTLPLYTPTSGLLAIEEDDASASEQAFNEIIVKGFDPNEKADFSVRAQNLASIQSLGVIISNTIEYKGIPTRELAAKVAMRELKAQTSLRRFTVRLDRRAWRLAPAGVFRISHPGRGIGNLILRIGEVTELDSISGEMEIKAVQDVFGLPLTVYYEAQEPAWTPPSFEAIPAPALRLVERTYRDAYLRIGAGDTAALDPDISFVGMVAERPAGLAAASGFDMAVNLDGGSDYTTVASNATFDGNATLDASITALATEITLDAAARDDWDDEVAPGSLALIGDEIVGVDSYDPVTGIVTVKRGVVDTIPAPHAAAVAVWLLEDVAEDATEYASGEEVNGIALTRTSTDLLSVAEAEPGVQVVTVVGRIAKPFPPGNVEIDGESIYAQTVQHPEPVITWTHRDRIAQADLIVGHGEGSVGPEPGTTYTIRVFLEGEVVPVREETGIVGLTWTYDAAMQLADAATPVVAIQLLSVRDGLESYQRYTFAVELANPASLTIDDILVTIDGETIEFGGGGGWFLTGGVWDDTGVWDDSALWED